MKKIINGKRYDTESARLVGEWSNECRGFDYCRETLYCKRTGEYFLHGYGGARSTYAEQHGNMWSEGEDIRPMTAENAAVWAEKHLTAEEYEDEFAVIEDTPETSIARNIANAREAVGMSQTDLAKAINATQAQISRYESGAQEPTASRIVAIANALNIEPGKLF